MPLRAARLCPSEPAAMAASPHFVAVALPQGNYCADAVTTVLNPCSLADLTEHLDMPKVSLTKAEQRAISIRKRQE
jgi:hypothetical protein